MSHRLILYGMFLDFVPLSVVEIATNFSIGQLDLYAGLGRNLTVFRQPGAGWCATVRPPVA